MSNTPIRAVLSVLATIAGLTVGLALTASAGGDYCEHKPWKCETTSTVAEETTTTAPEEETTTTTEEETTTTVEETTTTTEEETTTTVVEEETTTTEAPTTTELVATTWSAEAFCVEDGTRKHNGAIRVDFNPDEIERIDATWEDDVFGANPVDPFLVPGVLGAPVASPATFRLIAVPRAGFEAIPTDVVVTVQPCPPTEAEPSSTTAPPASPTTTTASPVETLPFTGPATGVGLAAVAAALIGGGLSLVMLKSEDAE